MSAETGAMHHSGPWTNVCVLCLCPVCLEFLRLVLLFELRLNINCLFFLSADLFWKIGDSHRDM